MLTSKTIEISHLNNRTLNKKTISSWMNVKAANNKQQISDLYDDICQQHYDKNKWILMINPEDEMLESFGKENKVGASNILRVNTPAQKMKIQHIIDVLMKGNCSAIVLAETYFNKSEIDELTNYAEQGRTQCVIIKSSMIRNSVTKNSTGLTHDHLPHSLH